MPGITVVDFPCDGYAPVVGTGGKQVLWGFHSTMQTAAGETLEMALNYKYTFGDDGKVVAYEQNWDTAPLDDANVATLKKMCGIAGGMKGKVLSAEVMQKLGADMAEFYAPRISCSSTPNSDLGWVLEDAPFTDCVAAGASK